jgi:hypothetical protein
MGGLLKLVTSYWSHAERTTETEKAHRVGEYRADYSQLTAEEIAVTDEECAELFKHSKPISR